jgi:hypothetical protein
LELPEDDPAVLRHRAALAQGLRLLKIAQASEPKKIKEGAKQAHSVVLALTAAEAEQRRRFRASGGQHGEPPSVADVFRSVASQVVDEGPAASAPNGTNGFPSFDIPISAPFSPSLPQAIVPTAAFEFDPDHLLQEMGLLYPSDDGLLGVLHWPVEGLGQWPAEPVSNLAFI